MIWCKKRKEKKKKKDYDLVSGDQWARLMDYIAQLFKFTFAPKESGRILSPGRGIHFPNRQYMGAFSIIFTQKYKSAIIRASFDQTCMDFQLITISYLTRIEEIYLQDSILNY